MKTKNILVIALITIAFITGCDNNKEKIIDLETGKTITVVKDSTTGYMINTETKEPVHLYVNTATNDTIYGRTGKVVNNLVIKTPDGKYTYMDDSEIEVRTGGSGSGSTGGTSGNAGSGGGDYKMKVEKDGDVKIKDGDTKIKIEDGEKKVKKDD